MHHRIAAVALSFVAVVGCDAGPKPTPIGTGKVAAAAPAASTAPTTTPGVPAPTAATGARFGAGVTLATSMPIDALLADPKAHVGKSVRVEGLIVDVCPKRGCWMDLAGAGPGQKLRFKVTDGDMVFPVDAKGKYAVVEGVVAVNELTLEQTKEYVAYQAREYGAAMDPAAVTAPMSIVRLDGTGAMLRDAR